MTRSLGFALADYFDSIGFAYLDFIVAQAERRGRGLGGAYEALREDLIARGRRGTLFEVPTDDPGQVPDSSYLKMNKSRLKFYEQQWRAAYRGHALLTSRFVPIIPPSRGCSMTPCRARSRWRRLSFAR